MRPSPHFPPVVSLKQLGIMIGLRLVQNPGQAGRSPLGRPLTFNRDSAGVRGGEDRNLLGYHEL